MKRWNWSLWGRGLLAAVINSATTTGVAVIVDPEHMSDPSRIGITVGASAVVGALLYMKTHPLPDLLDEVNTAIEDKTNNVK